MPKFWRTSIVTFLRLILMNMGRREGIVRTFLLGSIRIVVGIRTTLLLRIIVIIPTRTIAPSVILVPRIRIASLLRSFVVRVAESINIDWVGIFFARVSPLITTWIDFSYATLLTYALDILTMGGFARGNRVRE